MPAPKPQTIDEVIDLLDHIIRVSEQNNDPAGYFAALYQQVTIQVKEGIANNFFDDSPRMEQLDVLFAQRYLDAWYAWQDGAAVTGSWQQAFAVSHNYWPIVLQHLLLGMNAHINLDLGIAATQIMAGKQLDDLHDDFNRINDILSSLVHEVQNKLSRIWPALKYILKWTGEVDDYLVDFSMQLARDGAWKFATQLHQTPPNQQANFIDQRDQRVATKVAVVLEPGLIANTVLAVVRLTERGTIPQKIKKLKA
ncbi:DUF5995 family protein [Sunxiuqinia elliptica]